MCDYHYFDAKVKCVREWILKYVNSNDKIVKKLRVKYVFGLYKYINFSF